MKSLLRATVFCLCLSSPILAHAQMQSGDWLLGHPYDQPERMQHGDWEVLQDLEWERSVFEADQYRHRQEAAEMARRAATLPPADYGRAMPRGN
jgi:hypothetical protein